MRERITDTLFKDENAVLLAQMKLSGKQDRPVVAMENFEHITSAVECNDSDGKMSMTFVSPETLEAAKSAWKWLSEEKGNEFLLVANHDGCGPDKERVPYRYAPSSMSTRVWSVLMMGSTCLGCLVSSTRILRPRFRFKYLRGIKPRRTLNSTLRNPRWLLL